MKKDIKDTITDEIIAMIENAQASGADWTMPFKSLGGKPTNAQTGKAYTRLNALWLGLQGYRTVATYKQWSAIGYQVQRGSIGIAISAPMTVKDKKTGDSKMIGFRAATVFPSSMVLNTKTGEPWLEPESDAVDLTERLALADQYVSNLGFDIRHSGEGRAYYSPAGDFIHMPERAAFSATKTSTPTENYYSTFLHESAHATGHKSRLDRLDLKNRKGYAFEELVAELSAAFLCNQLGVSGAPREDHAQYLASWLTALDGDNDYIFKAASEAQKVVDWMDAKQVALELQDAA